MRKVLKFVKGKRDDKKDHGSSNLGPFSMEITTPSPGTPGEDEHYMPFNQGCSYAVDTSGKDKTVTKLHKAAWLGNLDKVKGSLKKIDIDAIDRLNRTALHLAAARGNTNIVWFLLNNKAKTTICDNEGRTPFLKAVECGHKDVIQLMLERGTDLNTVDYGGNSCLHIAAKQGFYEIASIILKQGGNFETSNSQGEFPLHIATCGDHRELVELILRYNASVNVVDRENRSPLMLAAKNGNMPLVQLFLEYGAQRRVMDSNDWTAEDYAQQAGHLDIAAELKSPSDLVEPNMSSEVELTPEALSLTKRSISPATNKKEDKENDVDSDTWDSQPSEAGSKRLTSTSIMKFLPPTSDDEISEEESMQSPKADAKDSEGTQDSPRSCVIPPPCKPPRSWDLIQAGMIDDIQTSSEPRRRSLLTLGSLRSKRESFTESPNAESPSFHSDGPHVGQTDADQWVKSHSFVKQDSSLQSHHLSCDSEKSRSNGKISPKLPDFDGDGSEVVLTEHKNEFNIFNTDKNAGSDSGSDWDSDDASLPIDNFPIRIPSKQLSGDRSSPVIVLETAKVDEKLEEVTKEFFKIPAIPSDKKGRFLLRVPPIDLTDEDLEFNKESELEKYKSDYSEIDKGKSSSTGGTLGRDGTLQGYEEVWEANAHIRVSTSNQGISGPSSGNSLPQSIEEILPQNNLSSNNLLQEDELIFPSPQLPERGRGDSPPSIPSPIVPEHKLKTSTSLEFKKQTLATYLEGKNNKMKYESHSLDNLDDSNEKPKPHRKHFRQMSVSSQSWRSEEIYHIVPQPLTNFDRMLPDNKRISAQLECYDEALRELAQVTVIKKQGSLPLVGPNEPHSARFSGAKKQRYLSLPRTNELIDEAFKEMGQSSVNTMQRGSLSLPRTTTPKDMLDFSHPSPPTLRGSSSLPRTATPKDMISETHPIPPPRRRRSLQAKRAGSEGEVRKSRDILARPLSLDIKLHKMDTTLVKLSKPHEISVENISIVKSPAGDENVSPNSSATPPSSVRRISIDKPIRKKRKTLIAMRGLNHQSQNNSQSSVASVEESFEEPPFWMSTDRGNGHLTRQSTVIERAHFGKNEAHGFSPTSMDFPLDAGPKESFLESSAVEQVSTTTPIVDNISKDVEEPQQNSITNKIEEAIDEQLSLPAPPEFISTAGSKPQNYQSPESDGKYDNSESPDNQRYSPSDESGLSQTDITPQHQAVRSHHSLLQQHLRATTAEKSRLEETAAHLGEKTEKLKYELADALEASRSRDEVIALLQGQLKTMEEMYTKCLEEVQRYRLILANQEQELAHLKDMCNKYDEEKTHMAEIIQSQELEKPDGGKGREMKEDDKMWEITVQLKEKEKQHHELQIHLKYLEEEKRKSMEDILKLEKKNEELERKLEMSSNKIQTLSEEKADLTATNRVDLQTMQADAQKWNQLYESCLLKLDQMATASIEAEARMEIKNKQEWMSLEANREELKELIQKLQETKEQDSSAWRNRIEENISNAALLLKNEYTKVECAIEKHNDHLESLIVKLQQDLDNYSTRQTSFETGLGQAKSELREASRSSVELATTTIIQELRQVNIELREHANQVKAEFEMRDEDLKKRLVELIETHSKMDINVTETLQALDSLRQENERLQLTLEYLKKHNAGQVTASSEEEFKVHEYYIDFPERIPFQNKSDIQSSNLTDKETNTDLKEPVEAAVPLHDTQLASIVNEKVDIASQTDLSFPLQHHSSDEYGDSKNVEPSQLTVSDISASNVELPQMPCQPTTCFLYDNSESVQAQRNSQEKLHPVTSAEESNVSQHLIELIEENTHLKYELNRSRKDFKNQEEELKRTLVVLKDTRNAVRAEAARENTDLRKQMETIKVKLRRSEQELIQIKKMHFENTNVTLLNESPSSFNQLKVNMENRSLTLSKSQKEKFERPGSSRHSTQSVSFLPAIHDEEDELITSFNSKLKNEESQTESKEKASPKHSEDIKADTPDIYLPQILVGDTKSDEEKESLSPSQNTNVNQTQIILDKDPLSPAQSPQHCSSAFCPGNKRFDTATNTHTQVPVPPENTSDLYQELQRERERVKKNQETIRKLKSDLQHLKVTCSDRNIGTSKCSLTNNNGELSPSHYEQLVVEFQRKVADLQVTVRDETTKRFALEVQVKKMNYDIQEKHQLEKELGILRSRLDKDFVSRYELEQMRMNYETAMKQTRLDAEKRSREEINGKLGQINNLIEKKVDEQLQRDQQRNHSENQMRQEFKDARLKLTSELSKAQITLAAKNEEDKQLRNKCDRLTQECKDKNEQRRQKLVEMSYNVNLTPSPNVKDKLPHKECVAACNPRRPQPQPSPATVAAPVAWPADNPFSEMLRKELEKSIRKHTQQDADQASTSRPQMPKTPSDEHMELLRKKYFLN